MAHAVQFEISLSIERWHFLEWEHASCCPPCEDKSCTSGVLSQLCSFPWVTDHPQGCSKNVGYNRPLREEQSHLEAQAVQAAL